MIKYFEFRKNIIKLLRANVTFDILIILSIVLFALLVRISIVASFYGYSPCSPIDYPTYTFCSDDALYMTMARYIVHGDFAKALHPIWPPLFPILSALIFLVVHNWALSPRIVSLLAGSLLVIPLYILCRHYFSRYVAIGAGILLTLLSPLVFASVQPLSDSLMVFFLWTGIAFLLIAFNKKKLKFAFFCGLFFGLTALTRVEGIFAFASFLLFFVVSLIFKEIRTRQFLKLFILVVIGFILIYEPYQMAMYNKFHQSMTLGKAAAIFNFRSHADLTQHGKSTFGQDTDSIETVNPHSEVYTGFIKILTQRYQIMIDDTKTRLKLETIIVGSYLNTIKVLLIFFGLIFLFKSSLKNKEMFFLYIFFLITLIGTTFFEASVEERYIFWLLPFIPILLSLGLVNLINALRNYMHLRIISVFAIYIVAIIYLSHVQLIYSINSVKSLSTINQKPIIIPEDAWLLKNAPKKRVMMHHEGYGFYSESFIIYTPNVDTLHDLVKYAHLWRVSYIVAEYGEIPDHLKFLLDKPEDYPGLKVIKGNQILLYKVL